MASPLSTLFYPLELRSVLGSALANPALYYEIGDPLELPCRIIKFDNLTNQTVFISMNGVIPFTVIPSGGFFLIDITANKSVQDELTVSKETQFWANASVVPTSGSVYVTAIAAASSIGR